jgi:predicted aspartyl protease
MRHTTEIKLVNRRDAILAEEGIIKAEDVRQLIVKDALVDTGATRLSLPGPLIQHLGLKPVGNTKSRTANGIVERTLYSEVKFTVLGRSGSMEVTDLPDDTPVLVGHYVIELLDLAIDPKRGLIYNPAHGDDWVEEQL